jgi:hypothetical protein
MEQSMTDVVRDVSHLIEKHWRDFRMLLGGGLAYSRKSIRYNPTSDHFDVRNHIDDTRQLLTPAELWTKSLLGEALDKGALVLE